MPDVPADSTFDLIALLVAAAGTFVFILKYSARKRAAASNPKARPASNSAEHGTIP